MDGRLAAAAKLCAELAEIGEVDGVRNGESGYPLPDIPLNGAGAGFGLSVFPDDLISGTRHRSMAVKHARRGLRPDQ